jgi:hypothetical protein
MVLWMQIGRRSTLHSIKIRGIKYPIHCISRRHLDPAISSRTVPLPQSLESFAYCITVTRLQHTQFDARTVSSNNNTRNNRCLGSKMSDSKYWFMVQSSASDSKSHLSCRCNSICADCTQSHCNRFVHCIGLMIRHTFINYAATFPRIQR